MFNQISNVLRWLVPSDEDEPDAENGKPNGKRYDEYNGYWESCNNSNAPINTTTLKY